MTDIEKFIIGFVGEERFAKMNQVLPYDNKIDYIGPERWSKTMKLATRFARYFFGIDNNRAGWAHDALYILGENEKDRDFADTAFLVIMNHIIDTKSSRVWIVGRIQRDFARTKAVQMYSLVRENGKHFFAYKKDGKPN